jgi:hypothetical protein
MFCDAIRVLHSVHSHADAVAIHDHIPVLVSVVSGSHPFAVDVRIRSYVVWRVDQCWSADATFCLFDVVLSGGNWSLVRRIRP